MMPPLQRSTFTVLNILSLLLCIRYATSRLYSSVSATLPYDLHQRSSNKYALRYNRRRPVCKNIFETSHIQSNDPRTIQLARRTKREKVVVVVEKENVVPRVSTIASSVDQNTPALTYRDLSPLGKLLAGTMEVSIATAMEYITGFMGGYFLGFVTDVPRMLTQKVEYTSIIQQQQQQHKLWQQMIGRTTRMHSKSIQWAQSWAGISAAFGAFRVATKVIRNGREDEWNTVMSSMAAGAYFARAEGPQAMLRGALMYGGLVYLLNGGLTMKKKPFVYEEERLDF